MKNIHTLLIAICASAVVLPQAMSSAAAQENTAPKSENSQPPTKKATTPHNHMRDAKGMSMSTKQSQSQSHDKTTPATNKETMDATPDSEKVKVVKKKPQPHSHPRDAKGM